MTSIAPRTYVFGSVYLGDAAPATGMLVSVPNLATGGTRIIDATPTERIPWLGVKCMSGLREVRVEAQYYDNSTSDLVELCTKGISLTGDFNDTSDLQDYTLFLVAPDESLDDSFYFPVVSTDIRYEQAFTKDNGIVIPVVFSITSERLDSNPYTRGTVNELITLLGSRSPI